MPAIVAEWGEAPLVWFYQVAINIVRLDASDPFLLTLHSARQLITVLSVCGWMEHSDKKPTMSKCRGIFPDLAGYLKNVWRLKNPH